MTNTVQLKRSAVAGKSPATTDLALGEIAINTYDGRVFAKMNNGAESIFEITGMTATQQAAFTSLMDRVTSLENIITNGIVRHNGKLAI